MYNRPTSTWFTVWLDTACGGQGLGGYKSTNPMDPTSWTHFCVHSSSQDDRNSGWADNNPASPFANRMYISWNDFNVGGGALFVTYSSDNGTTWHAPVQVTTGFIRDVQITGDKVTGDVYLAGMDENAVVGCGTNRNNKIFRSTDGGNTFTNTYTGPAFVGPCRSIRVSSPRCTAAPLTGGTWAGVSLPPSTMWLALSMPPNTGTRSRRRLLHSFHRQRCDLRCAGPVERQH